MAFSARYTCPFARSGVCALRAVHSCTRTREHALSQGNSTGTHLSLQTDAARNSSGVCGLRVAILKSMSRNNTHYTTTE